MRSMSQYPNGGGASWVLSLQRYQAGTVSLPTTFRVRYLSLRVGLKASGGRSWHLSDWVHFFI